MRRWDSDAAVGHACGGAAALLDAAARAETRSTGERPQAGTAAGATERIEPSVAALVALSTETHDSSALASPSTPSVPDTAASAGSRDAAAKGIAAPPTKAAPSSAAWRRTDGECTESGGAKKPASGTGGGKTVAERDAETAPAAAPGAEDDGARRGADAPAGDREKSDRRF